MKLKYICPFCFQENRISEVEFACEARKRCGKPDAGGKITNPGQGEPNEKLAQYLGLSPTAVVGPHHFAAEKRALSRIGMPKTANCDWCGQTSHTRVCPDCHNVLPSTIDTDEDMIIALIGTRSSGKSTYIGVLIHEMIKHLFHGFNGTFQLYGQEDRERYRNDFEKSLYQDHKPLPQTQSGDKKVNRPILGTLRIASGKWRKKIKTVSLVFFDSAGEDWEDQDTINVVARYVSHSAGIIFLVDPLANSVVRSNIANDEAVNTSGGMHPTDVSEPAAVLSMVANLIRHGQGLSDKKRIDVPVALAFSKLDVLEDNGQLPPGSTLSQPSPHVASGAFIPADQQAVDGELRSLLDRWDQADLLQKLELEYANNSCFAFSAIGRAPKADGTIQPPNPKRIEDAMMWILHQQEVI